MSIQFHYSKINITKFKIILSTLLLLSIQPASSLAQIIDKIIQQDTTRQDTTLVKPDSVSIRVTQKIFNEDTSFVQYMKSPWQMPKVMMDQYFHEDIGDLLNYFPGIYLQDMGSSGQRLGLSCQGAKDRQTLLYFDGRPFYDPIYGGIDLNFIPVNFIRSITIEQGLSSFFVTSNAEMVSLKSEQYQEDIPYSQVSYHKAPHGFSDIDIVFGQKISNRTNLLLGGIIKSYDGKTNAYSFEQQNFRGKVDYQLSPSWKFVYSWISNKINRHVPNPVIAEYSYSPIDATQKVNRLDHTLNIKGRIFKSYFQNFHANLFYSSGSDKLKDKNFNLQTTNLSRYAGFNLQIQNRWLGQRIITGTSVIYEWTDADELGNNKYTFGSVFVQNDWTWKERLGIRILGDYKFQSTHPGQLSGGMSSFVSLSKNAKITASAKQSICYPTLFELNATTNFVGNSDLMPEIQQKIELGADWEIDTKFSFKSAFYYKNIQHTIQLTPIDSLKATFINQTEIQYPGFDFQITWNFLSKFFLNTLCSVIEKKNLVNQPEIMLTGYLQYTDSFFQDDIRPTIRLEGRYFGERNSLITHPYFYEVYQKKLSSDLIFNAHAILDFGNLKIFFTLENILNKKYQSIYGYAMNERTLHYGLRWEFWN